MKADENHDEEKWQTLGDEDDVVQADNANRCLSER